MVFHKIHFLRAVVEVCTKIHPQFLEKGNAIFLVHVHFLTQSMQEQLVVVFRRIFGQHFRKLDTLQQNVPLQNGVLFVKQIVVVKCLDQGPHLVKLPDLALKRNPADVIRETHVLQNRLVERERLLDGKLRQRGNDVLVP